MMNTTPQHEPPAHYCAVQGDAILNYANAAGVPVHEYGGFNHVPVWLVLAWTLQLDTQEGLLSASLWKPCDVSKYLEILHRTSDP